MTRDRRYLDAMRAMVDRKSTRLNSSHSQISYAVFCLKKKKKKTSKMHGCRRRAESACSKDDGAERRDTQGSSGRGTPLRRATKCRATHPQIWTSCRHD